MAYLVSTVVLLLVLSVCADIVSTPWSYRAPRSEVLLTLAGTPQVSRRRTVLRALASDCTVLTSLHGVSGPGAP